MKSKKLTSAALVTAIVCITTLFTSIPLPFSNGFFNLGDFAILVSVVVTKDKNTILSAGIGSALADLTLGYLQYLPFTLVIKAIEAAIILTLLNKGVKYYFSFAIALTLMAIGYGLTDAILIQTPSYFFVSFGANMIQAITTLILGILTYPIINKLKRNTSDY